MSISESSKVKHQFYPSIEDSYDEGIIISVIIDCFHGLEYIKQSIRSVLDQDYSNVELLLVNNGASEDIAAYLKTVHASNKNTSLITYEVNQFSWDDFEKTVPICWNAGLKHCKGEIVTHLSYDDMFSKNYASKMARLFEENPKCNTASPLPVCINEAGEIITSSDFLPLNNRQRYEEGKKVAIDYIKGSPQKMFCAPGEILAFRKSILLQYSGFERGIDILQLLKYAIHGDIGFDPKAYVYWRRHALQTNRMGTAKGHINFKNEKKNIQQSNLINIWKNNFSLSEVELLEVFFKNRLKKLPISKARQMVGDKNLYGLLLVFINTAKECPELLIQSIFSAITYALSIILNKLKKG